jgi:hypothetical protein
LLFDEDADIRSHLAALGPVALSELRRVLEAPGPYRTAVLRALTARPASADLATLIAMADTNEVVRLRLLRAIRDLGWQQEWQQERGARPNTPSDQRAGQDSNLRPED